MQTEPEQLEKFCLWRYETPDYLFSGSEEELKDFINKNISKTKVASRYSKKGFIIETKVCGYPLNDFYITIEGPDIRSYIE